MEPVVDTVIEDARWQVLNLPALAERAALESLAELGLSSSGYCLCVMGCDDARIAVLNGDFRAKPQATNVLSWPSEERGAQTPGARPDRPEPGTCDDPLSLGDIAIAYDTCASEAKSAGKSLTDHVSHLLVHGTLHLLGYDHVDDKDAELMEATEVRILARLGLCDPYT